MAKEYTITKVSSDAPREWKNGISYYKVMFAEHDRPVSVGKKSTPQAGDTVYGNITADPDHAEDKFKSESRPDYPSASQTRPKAAGATFAPKHDYESMYRCNALNNALAMYQTDQNVKVTEVAQTFYEWLSGATPTVNPKVKEPETVAMDLDEDINLDDIPF